MKEQRVRTAFFSVSDKTDDVYGLAYQLKQANPGWVIYSSGGTSKYLHERGIPNGDVSELTVASQVKLIREVMDGFGFAAVEDDAIRSMLRNVAPKLGGEMLGGRVKTMRPEVLAGMLARDTEEDWADLNAMDYKWFDLVLINLYPFQKTVEDPACTLEKAIENIDVGGVTMLHAMSKGFRDGDGRVVLCDYADLPEAWNRVKHGDLFDPSWTRSLVSKAERYLSDYLRSVSQYLEKKENVGCP